MINPNHYKDLLGGGGIVMCSRYPTRGYVARGGSAGMPGSARRIGR